MKRKHNKAKSALLLSLATACLAAGFNTSAATLTWDANGAAVPNPNDGSGTWMSADSWFDGVNNVAWTAANTAIFGAGSDGTYSIDMTGLPYPSVQTITFNNSGYTLTSPAPTLMAVSTTTGSSASQLRIATGKSATIGSNVTIQQTAAQFIYIGAPAANPGGTLTLENGATVRNTNANFTCLIDGFGTVVTVKTGGMLGHVGTGNQFCSVGQQAGSSCTLNIDGGTWSSSASGALAGFVVGQLGIGVVNLNSGTASMTSGATTIGLTLGNNTAGNGTFNLNGGVLNATLVRRGTAGTSGGGTNSVFNFNGGVLKALIDQPSFMTNIVSATVMAGGALVDDSGFAITIGQPLLAGTPSGGLTKLGTGTLSLAGANTYTGTTVISNGVLALASTGSIANSTNILLETGVTFDVSSVTGFTIGGSQALGGSGVVTGAVIVAGTVAPGRGGISTLSFSTAPTLAGKAVVKLNRSAGQRSDSVVIGDSSTLSYAGVLVVTNIGSTLQVGDSFKLFTATNYSGAFSSITYPAGYTFTNRLAIDGTIGVLTAPSVARPTLSFTQTNGNWTFVWNGSGYKLQGQTNTVTVGLSTNWSDVPGGSNSGVTIPAPVTSNGAVFFRLVSTP